MTTPSPYLDIRQSLFRDYFEKSLDFNRYVAQGSTDQQHRWNEALARTTLDPQDLTRLGSFIRTMPLLVVSGIWCGDCSRQGPILRRFQEACPLLDLRFIESKAHPELQDELRINGAQKVPVVLAFSEDFYEIARFGDKHLSAYREKAKRELGAACDPGILPPSTNELRAEVSEWLDFIERLQLMLRLSPALRRRYGD